ncbi:MAG: molybdopterin molybdotransferase MoeA [Gemmatimonadota bacterium]|nr:molybdopterin molybdotransferase MoeA [Gemmatimonadota bacterium]
MLETAPSILSVREAQTHILDRIRPLPPERVTLSAALGRAVREPVVARVDVPPWDNAAMDGYAVRAEGIRKRESLPVALDVPAGSPADRALPEGTVARIMTGAPIPSGADAVVPVEHTSGPDGRGEFAEVGDSVRFVEPVAAGDHVRRRGEDVRRGEVAVAEGATIDAPEIAMAATVGRASLTVHRRPRVAIVSTGDELVDIEEAGAANRIVNGNAWGLAAAVEEAGGIPVVAPIAPDEPGAIRDAVRAALRCDATITIGGVSVGEFDHVRDALEAEGVTIEFWRVAIKPGGPTAFGTSEDGGPVFGLPGNPVSALVTFEAFARPAVLRLAGHRRCFRRSLEARLSVPVRGRRDKAQWLRGGLERDASGWTVAPTGPQGSGILSSLVEANALILVPPTTGELEAGTLVEVLPLGAGRSEAP